MSLQTISINDLQAGMKVYAIADQAGKLVVKHKGQIKHNKVIKLLRSKGVKTVVVDTLTQIQPTATQGSTKAANSEQEGISEAPVVHTSLAEELKSAERILQRCNAYNQSLVSAIQSEERIDIALAKTLSLDIYASLQRNKNGLLCLSTISEADNYLSAHAARVAILMCCFAMYLRMSKDECIKLCMLGLLYDIGLLDLDISMLDKNEKLAIEEALEVQQHVQKSMDLLSGLGLDREFMLAVEQHHERLDGSGYPNSVEGSQIHKYSRMLALVDAFDSLTSKRPYRNKSTAVAALKVLNDNNNGYDKKLALKFVRCLGVYPTGSLVLLSDNTIAIVVEQHHREANKPLVKPFYTTLGRHYLVPQVLDISDSEHGIKIVKSVLASQYKISLEPVMAS